MPEREGSQGYGVAGASPAAEQGPVHDRRRERRFQRVQVPLSQEQDRNGQG